MKKVLVIGGTGTISTPVTKTLASREDIDLYVLNRGNKKSILPSNVHHLIGDVKEDVNGVKELLKNLSFDSVINFVVMNLEDAKKNVEIFKGKTKQFIFISTNCVLNHTLTCNIDETVEKGNTFYAYGQNKAAVEDYFTEESKKGDFPLTIVRPTQTYSDHRIPLSVKGSSCWSVVSRMLKGKEVIIHGDGQSVWGSTHANDFAKLFCPLVAEPKTIGEIYQVMNPEPHTWDMIYQTLADLLGVEYKPVYISTYLLDKSQTYNWKESIHGDKHFSNIFDISKVAEFCPDVTCDIDIKKGLQMFLEYMDAHPEMKKEDEKFDEWCDKTIEAYKKFAEAFTENI